MNHIRKLLSIVILKSLVMFTNLISRWIHHIRLVEPLQSGLINIRVRHLWILHLVVTLRMHLNGLLLMHVKWLTVRILMHSLWRVKAIWMDLLVELVHLIWHLHMLIHAHLRLVLHLSIRVHHSHLLIGNALVLQLVLLSVLYVFNSLLMWLHLINMFLILLN